MLIALTVAIYMFFPKAEDTSATSAPSTAETSVVAQATAAPAQTTTKTAQTLSAATQPATVKQAEDTAVTITELGNTTDGKIKIDFTGDINLDEKWETGPMQFYKPGISSRKRL